MSGAIGALDPALSTRGVGESERGGVEHEPGDRSAGQDESAAVAGIAGNGPADRGHVDAQLVHAAGARGELDQGGRVADGQGAVAGGGGLSVGVVWRADLDVGLAALALLAQGDVDPALARLGRAGGDDGQVGLPHTAAHHRLPQERRARLAAGGEDDAGGVAVEPVDQARLDAAGLGEGGEKVVEGMGGDPPALAGEPGGLVQGDDFAVLVDDQRTDKLDFGVRQRFFIRR